MMYESAAQAFVAFGFSLAAIMVAGGIIHLTLTFIEWILRHKK